MRKALVFCLTVIIGLLFSRQTLAQVLVTGETGGKGNQTVFLSANGLFPEGLRLFNAYGQYVYGLNNRVDVLAAYGNISALSQSQQYIGMGWNAHLFKRNRTFVDVSFFNVVTLPLNKRKDASTVLMTPAIVASRPLSIAGKPLAVYSGISFLVPIGAVKDKLFTPPETFINIPVGVSIPLGRKWFFYAEVDPGTNLTTTGFGLARTF